MKESVNLFLWAKDSLKNKENRMSIQVVSASKTVGPGTPIGPFSRIGILDRSNIDIIHEISSLYSR
jgi:hypothetical protein